MSYSYYEEAVMWAEEDSLGYTDVCLQSAVVPMDGKLYVMFHGTTVEDAASIIRNGFQRSSNGMYGPGVYVSRQYAKAERYPIAHIKGQNVVLKLRVNVGRVIKIERQNHPLQKTWHRQYDTAWTPPGNCMVPSRLEEDCISNPTRIKVIDVAFASSPDILRALKALIHSKMKK